MAFERRFANLAVDILALDCDEQITCVHRTPHSQVIASFSDAFKTSLLDVSVIEKFGRLDVSVAPNTREILVKPRIGEILPEITCTFRPETQKKPDVRVAVPFAGGFGSGFASFAVIKGEKEAEVFFTRAIRIQRNVFCNVSLKWRLDEKPVCSALVRSPYVSAFTKLGMEKQRGKLQVNAGPLFAFGTLGVAKGNPVEEKCGFIASCKKAVLGLRFDFMKKTAKVKTELRGAAWALAHMVRFGKEEEVRAQAGAEWNGAFARTRCVFDTQGTAVLEGKTMISKRSSAKVGVKYDPEAASRFSWGFSLKFDHR